MLPAQSPATSPKQMDKRPGKISWPWGKMDCCSNERIETRVLMHSRFTNPFIIIFVINIIKIKKKKLVRIVFFVGNDPSVFYFIFDGLWHILYNTSKEISFFVFLPCTLSYNTALFFFFFTDFWKNNLRDLILLNPN